MIEGGVLLCRIITIKIYKNTSTAAPQPINMINSIVKTQSADQESWMVVSVVETSSIGEGASRKTVFNKKKQVTFPFSDVEFFV